MNQKRLYRSADDRIIAGVAGGVAEYFDVDPVIVRIIWFFSVILTAGTTFLAYIVMIIVVPLEPEEWPAPSPWAPGGTPIGAAPTGSTPMGFAAAYTPPTEPGAPQPAGQPGEAAPTSTDPTAQAAEGTAAPADPNAPQVPPASAPFVAGQPTPWGPAPTGDWRWQRRAERWQRRQERWETRGRGSGGLMFGLLLIVVGGLLAWHQVDPNVDLGLAWPIGVVVLGVILVASSIRFGSKS